MDHKTKTLQKMMGHLETIENESIELVKSREDLGEDPLGTKLIHYFDNLLTLVGQTKQQIVIECKLKDIPLKDGKPGEQLPLYQEKTLDHDDSDETTTLRKSPK